MSKKIILLFILIICLSGCNEKSLKSTVYSKKNLSKISVEEATKILESFFKRPDIAVRLDYTKEVKINGEVYYAFGLDYQLGGADVRREDLVGDVLINAITKDIFEARVDGEIYQLGKKLN